MTVTNAQRAILEQIVRWQTSAPHQVRRARILLLAAVGADLRRVRAR